jgi:hypothetical protein
MTVAVYSAHLICAIPSGFSPGNASVRDGAWLRRLHKTQMVIEFRPPTADLRVEFACCEAPDVADRRTSHAADTSNCRNYSNAVRASQFSM